MCANYLAINVQVFSLCFHKDDVCWYSWWNCWRLHVCSVFCSWIEETLFEIVLRGSMLGHTLNVDGRIIWLYLCQLGRRFHWLLLFVVVVLLRISQVNWYNRDIGTYSPNFDISEKNRVWMKLFFMQIWLLVALVWIDIDRYIYTSSARDVIGVNSCLLLLLILIMLIDTVKI